MHWGIVILVLLWPRGSKLLNWGEEERPRGTLGEGVTVSHLAFPGSLLWAGQAAGHTEMVSCSSCPQDTFR